jgi:hypothetical protein
LVVNKFHRFMISPYCRKEQAVLRRAKFEEQKRLQAEQASASPGLPEDCLIAFEFNLVACSSRYVGCC